MRSNGTALVVSLASFPNAPLVTVPAAIYIIFQHLLAGIVKSRLAARFGDIDSLQAAATGRRGPRHPAAIVFSRMYGHSDFGEHAKLWAVRLRRRVSTSISCGRLTAPHNFASPSR